MRSQSPDKITNMSTSTSNKTAINIQQASDANKMHIRKSLSLGRKHHTQNSMADSDLSCPIEFLDGKSDLTFSDSDYPSHSRITEKFNPNANQTLLDKIEESSGLMRKTSAIPEYFTLPQDAPEWVEEIFVKYISGKDTWRSDAMTANVNKKEWNVVHDHNKLKILQFTNKASVFKCHYILENASAEKLLQVTYAALSKLLLYPRSFWTYRIKINGIHLLERQQY